MRHVFALQEKVFVDVLLYFGRRPREDIRDLNFQNFWLTANTVGIRYIYIKTNEETKKTFEMTPKLKKPNVWNT